MTEQEWSLLQAEWSWYCRICKLTDSQEQVDQLWGCLSSGMKRATTGDGMEQVSDATNFLQRIKILAVKKHNPLVAQVKFLSTGQDRDEPIHSYVARLSGMATQCNFTVVCCKAVCYTTTSYADRMISNMMVRGLEDLGVKGKIMILVAEKGEQTLTQLVAHVEAMDSSGLGSFPGLGAAGNQGQNLRGSVGPGPSVKVV